MYNNSITLLYVILVLIISIIIVRLDSTLWLNVFEAMFSAYLLLIYDDNFYEKKYVILEI